MEKTNKADPLTKISSVVSSRDKKIWENKAHSICINKETEKLKSEISQIKKATEMMEKEDKDLEVRLKELTKSLTIIQGTLRTSEKSLLTEELLKETLIQTANKMKKKYAATVEMYNDEYQEYRSVHEKACTNYKELHIQQLLLKKLKIRCMDLAVKISNLQRCKKQFQDIQKQIFQTTIIKFAKFYTLYHKNERIKLQLQELKSEEKYLLKQHLELVEKVKLKQKRKIIEKNQARMKDSFKIDENVPQKSSEENTPPHPEENKKISPDKLQRFLSEEIQPFSLTSLDSLSRRSKFNQDNSKVRILDMKIMKPPPLKPNLIKKPNLELKKKMESIINTTKKSVLKSRFSTTNPVSLQKPQKTISKGTPTGVSQTMSSLNLDDKPLTPKKNILVNPILKPAKKETISKFFNTKKKSVTFQTEDRNQKEKQIQEMVSFQSEDKSIKPNQELLNRFNFSGNKVDKSIDFNPAELFQKPFDFKKETPLKQEEKKFENPLGKIDIAPKKPESEVVASTGSSSCGFTGPSFSTYGNESGEKKIIEESFDPFEASFNRSFMQSPLKQPENFEQSFKSNTFNFFSSQKKNDLFNIF